MTLARMSVSRRIFTSLPSDFDLGAGVLAVDHDVADADRQLCRGCRCRAACPGPTDTTVPRCGFSLAGVGQHDTAGRALLGFAWFDNHAIIQRTQACMFAMILSPYEILRIVIEVWLMIAARGTAERLTSCRPCHPCHPCLRPCLPCRPIPPMPWSWRAWSPPSSSSLGISVMSDSVVSSNAATLAAFCKAVRTTLAGSMMPAATRSQYCVLVGVVAVVLTLHLPHAIDDHRAVDARVLGDGTAADSRARCG